MRGRGGQAAGGRGWFSRRKKREGDLDPGKRETSGHTDTCCHGLVAVSCHLSGRVCTENTMGLPRQEDASCFAPWVHCRASRGRVCRSVFFTLPSSRREGAGRVRTGVGAGGGLKAGERESRGASYSSKMAQQDLMPF